ncbi:MAG TPA: serine hydrolase domain-containing protein [Vicinamibacterales bacterium]|jgi:CubicO group peptidase (beta-lactamase class C family)
MRRLLLVTTTIVLSTSVLFGAADDLIVSRFGDYLDSLRAQAGIPGLSATLIRPGDSVWEQGFGRRDVDRALSAQPDTPFEIDGLTTLLSSTLVLRCVEEGRLALDDLVAQYSPTSPDAGATIRQLLNHTSASPDGLVYSYRPARLDSLAPAIAHCTGLSLRESMADLLERLIMYDSIPGADTLSVIPPTDGMTPARLERYTSIFDNLAKPYSVDARGRPSASEYVALTLTPASGLISTVRDLARFDDAIRKGLILKPETLAAAWTPPVDRDGLRLPHGLGWFVQNYNGERIVWQFGVSDNASSSLYITVPGRGTTLILLANGQGLARPFPLDAGDVLVSPFGRLFLSIFVR